jgi:hypothetical protein
MSPVACRFCGQEWPEHPARAVPCPRCNAEPGRPCKRPSEHELYGGQVHKEREELALERGLMQVCPAGPTARAEKASATEKDPVPSAEHPALF